MRKSSTSICLALLLGVGLLGACDTERHPQRASAATPTVHPSTLGPMETLRLLRRIQPAGDLAGIEPFLLADQRELVIAQIRAVDRLIDATALLRTRLEKRFGLGAAQDFDYGQVANILGVLSRDVTLLAETIQDERARVTFQVADRVPLEAVEMVRRGDRWLLVVDPIAGVPEEIEKLAAVIAEVADGVRDGTYVATGPTPRDRSPPDAHPASPGRACRRLIGHSVLSAEETLRQLHQFLHMRHA